VLAHNAPIIDNEDYNYEEENIPVSSAMESGIEYAEDQFIRRDADEKTQV
jgi:hypothetical protein